MNDDDAIKRASRRLVNAREFQAHAEQSVWSPDMGLPLIDWPAVATLERQWAAAALSLAIDMKKETL